MKIWYIIAAQLPQHLILHISETPISARKKYGAIMARKRCMIDYPCDEDMLRDQFGWRKYMEKWITPQQNEVQ